MAKIQTNGSGSVYTVNGSVLLTDDSGGGSSGTRDVTLTRISDDNGNEIGTWYMNFADANGNEYKVVCLDAQYRGTSVEWCSNDDTAVTGLLSYANDATGFWYNDALETATSNTQVLLDYCAANNYTSGACTHCRSQSFTINGTTYYGQLPNMRELWDLWRHRASIESMDTSASTSTSTNFSTKRSVWSSTQEGRFYAWALDSVGAIINSTKSATYPITCPVLEIPLNSRPVQLSNPSTGGETPTIGGVGGGTTT